MGWRSVSPVLINFIDGLFRHAALLKLELLSRLTIDRRSSSLTWAMTSSTTLSSPSWAIADEQQRKSTKQHCATNVSEINLSQDTWY